MAKGCTNPKLRALRDSGSFLKRGLKQARLTNDRHQRADAQFSMIGDRDGHRPSEPDFCMMTWLPRRRTSANPCASSIRHASRPESRLSLANGYFDVGDVELPFGATLYLLR